MDADPISPRLMIKLVPRDQWGANLSQSLRGPRWDALRRETYRRAGHVCQICARIGTRHPVEAHEDWDYDESEGTQRLVRLMALCPACHEVQHFGLASIKGRATVALRHLMAVNAWDAATARAHVDLAFETWIRRNAIRWTLDLSALTDYGLQPPTPAELEAAVRRRRRQIEGPPRRP